MYLKVMEADGRRIVAVCDRELLGQKFEEGERILDLDGNRHFYEGEVRDRAAVLNALSAADSVNLVGERAVGIGKEAGLVEEGCILRVCGVPHAQVYKIER